MKPNSNETAAPVKLRISQAESKRVLAIVAHLRQIFQTATDGVNVFRPIQMDQADLILSSASFRALFFDHPEPILISFLKHHRLRVEIECLETNIGLLLLSRLAPDEQHTSDLFWKILRQPDLREAFPLNEKKQAALFFTEKRGFEKAILRPEVWAPSREADAIINSGLGISNSGAPAQLLQVTRRRLPIDEWGSVRVGYLKDRPIPRRSLLPYVANQLGGVHYDKARLDTAEFKILASAYDWDNQAIMHGGLVAVGISCLELLCAPDLMALYNVLEDFLAARQRRLESGNNLDEPSVR